MCVIMHKNEHEKLIKLECIEYSERSMYRRVITTPIKPPWGVVVAGARGEKPP